jgi:mannose-6-phosphate isomerase
MVPLYPLRFDPIFKQQPWGGTELLPLLNRASNGVATGEAWLLSDVDGNESCVQNGPLRGTSLRQLATQRRAELLGSINLSQGRFPILLKLIDAKKELSVQVHPNDAQAEARARGQLGKTEAWVVLTANPESSLLYVGLKPGVDRPALEAGITNGTAADLLHSFKPQVGDCVLINAGTVHAIGRDLLLFEIQQTSDLTYRLYDWGRVDNKGQSRPLHIEDGLECTDFGRGPVEPLRVDSRFAKERLIDCKYFSLVRQTVLDIERLGCDERCSVYVCIEGEGQLEGEPFGKGDVVLLPASASHATLEASQPMQLLCCEPR